MPLTIEDLEAMVASGISAAQLLAVIVPQFRWLQRHREKDRDRKRKRVPRNSADVLGIPRTPIKKEKKDTPSIEVPNGTSISGRAKQSKRSLPDNWNPIVAEADAAELQRFRDYAKANGKLYADWDAAWRNWKTSPYRKPNGGHSNGQGRRHGSILDAADRLQRRIDEEGLSFELDIDPSQTGARCLPKG